MESRSEHVEIEEGPAAESIALAAVGYLPVLFFLPLLVRKEDEFARFHGKQSLVLFLALVALWVCIWVVDLLFGRVLGSMLLLGVVFKGLAWFVHNIVGGLVSLSYIVVMVLGVVQASLGRYWRMPLLGVYAERLRF